jgi:hypothetical protein
MADKDTTKEAERASQIQAKSIDQIKESRDLQKELAKILKSQGTLYEEHTDSIGLAAKKLTQIDVLNAKIRNSTATANSLSMRGVELSKQMTKQSEKVNQLQEKRIEHQLELADLAEKMRNHVSGVAVLADLAAVKRLELAIKDEKLEIKKAKGRETYQRNKLSGMDKELKATLSMKKNEEETVALNKIKILMLEQLNKLSAVTLSFYKKIWEIFKQFDEGMFSLRKHFGLFRNESAVIEDMAKSIAVEFAGLGVTIEMSSGAIKAIGDSFGLLSSFTKEMVSDISLFSASLGISEKTSASVLHTFASMSGKVLKDSNEGMMGFASSLSAAAGTNLNEVMSDIAQSSDSVRSTFRGNTIELIKATVEARRMGMSLEGMAKTSESLLDFNSSVNAEMEASVLLGKNLNFIEARRAAFVGDYRKQSEEILKVVQRAGDFDKMNMMQRQALAKAAGMSVGELQKMVQRKKEIDYIEKSGTDAQKAQLKREREMLTLAEAEAKDIGKVFDKRMAMESNQTRMNNLQQQFNKLILDIGKPILDVIEPLLRLAVEILPKITNFFKSHPVILKGTLITITAISVALSAAVTTMTALATISTIFGTGIALTSIAAAKAAASVALFGTAIAAVWVAAAAAVGVFFYYVGGGIYDRFTEQFDVLGDWLVEKWDMICDDFLGGITSINKDILSALTWPFESFWSWVKNLGILGNSPSKLGLSIVDGIISVGTMLLDALMYPFKSAYTFITELFGKIPEFISSVFKRGIDFAMKLPGMGGLMKVMDKLTGSTSTPTASAETKNSTNSKDTDQLVLAKLTELVDLMRAGGIVINLDGRKVSEALAHASR